MITTPSAGQRRRLCSVTAALATGTLVLSACGGTAEGDDGAEVDLEEVGVGAMEDYGVGDTFVASEPVDFSLLYRDHPNYPLQADWRFFTYLEEEHNVTLNPENAPLSDWEERRSLVIGAGDAPDFIPIVYPGDETPFIAGGALLPVSDYLDQMPHLTEKIEAWDLEEDFNALYQEDGRFYILPGIHEQPQHQYSLAVRGDIWDELGYEDPETWEEFAEQLRGVQEAYPEMVPYSDRWELQATLNLASPNFGTSAGWGFGDGMYFDDDADEFIYAGVTDEYRDLLEYFHGLVDEGLMDSESMVQDDDQAIQKFASGQSAVIGANDQELLTYRTSIEEVGDEDMDIRMIRVPAGPSGDSVAGGQLESGLVISSSAAEQDHFVALLQFIDWLYYSDEGLELAKWGVEGETFERDGEERVLADDIDINGLNSDADDELNVDHGFHNGVFMPAHGSTTDLVQSMLRDEVVDFRESMEDKEILPVPPARPLDELEREQASLTENALSDSVDTATAQFILGQRDLDDWDAYVAELEAQGLADFVELQNEAYQRAQEAIDGVEEEIDE
ncbi:extracellular solute-binding protein [Nesterenkonia xinjiangensis]|uniref:Putative aldouronate transport system substrate-binding protein n=1 Tax=Nesterenkonia xinjiangensis TaxID=225327 RepID=A0A7Z0GNS3_9MICC|nr:extracellular solute-binding protein [Nesterenkonia xinjiangensis]NYJ78298.1 putative aldouronate transport system substrate-binding protein [Nesterenkonia xinjiangensis]